jgi:hypothetical protein
LIYQTGKALSPKADDAIADPPPAQAEDFYGGARSAASSTSVRPFASSCEAVRPATVAANTCCRRQAHRKRSGTLIFLNKPGCGWLLNALWTLALPAGKRLAPTTVAKMWHPMRQNRYRSAQPPGTGPRFFFDQFQIAFASSHVRYHSPATGIGPVDAGEQEKNELPP